MNAGRPALAAGCDASAAQTKQEDIPRRREPEQLNNDSTCNH